MILNKFSSVTLSGRLKVLSVQLMALSLFSCNKTANISANKAFVSFMHVAYQVDPLTLKINDSTVFLAIPYDSATGHPYANVTSQISNASIFENSDSFLSGFDERSKSMIILQDNPPLNTDSTVSIRYLNFTPSSLIGLLLINTRQDIPFAGDTITISPAPFVGLNNNPAAYTFRPILAGTYNIFAFTDSIRAAPDSANIRFMGNFPFSITSNYNFIMMGFGNLDSGQYKLQFKPVALN